MMGGNGKMTKRQKRQNDKMARLRRVGLKETGFMPLFHVKGLKTSKVVPRA